jgi:hypothetical protein
LPTGEEDLSHDFNSVEKLNFWPTLIPATEFVQLKPLIADFFKETFMPLKTKSVSPTVFYRTLNVEGLEILS